MPHQLVLSQARRRLRSWRQKQQQQEEEKEEPPQQQLGARRPQRRTAAARLARSASAAHLPVRLRPLAQHNVQPLRDLRALLERDVARRTGQRRARGEAQRRAAGEGHSARQVGQAGGFLSRFLCRLAAAGSVMGWRFWWSCGRAWRCVLPRRLMLDVACVAVAVAAAGPRKLLAIAIARDARNAAAFFKSVL